MRTKYFAVVLASALCFVGNGATGSLIFHDWMASGDDLIVEDTSTGLDWLSPLASLGLTFNSVLAQTSSGGTFDGWHYSNFAELNNLLTNTFSLVVTIDSSTATAAKVPAIQTLFNAFGDLSVPPDFVYLAGKYDSGAATTDGFSFSYIFHGTVGSTEISTCCNSRNQADSDFGSWLIRVAPQSVPEPATLALLGLGLAGLGFSRRKQ